MARGVPWAALPQQLADLLRPHLATVTADVLAAIRREVPSYARPLEGRFGDTVRLGVQVALERFLDLPGTRAAALPARSREVYVRLGRGELRQGRSLEALLAAYRTGARVTFRGFAAVAPDPGLLVPLAESIFVYVDELSSASAAGYAAEQSERAGETGRRRAELLALLLAGGADAVSAAEAAARAGWPVPAEVVAVAFPPGAGRRPVAPELLVGPYGEGHAGLAPAPRSATARARLAASLAGAHAAVGPVRPLAGAPTSLRLAVLALPLARLGVLAGDPVWVDAHLPEMLVHAEPELARELAAARLAPLAGLRPAARERLEATLLAWLRHRGERGRVAGELAVHPQTVGYRLNQLRDLFGADLDDPDARFALELALRSRHVRAASPRLEMRTPRRRRGQIASITG